MHAAHARPRSNKLLRPRPASSVFVAGHVRAAEDLLARRGGRRLLRNNYWCKRTQLASGGAALPAAWQQARLCATHAQAHHLALPVPASVQCWMLAGAHMYSEPGLRTVELRPFVLPPGPSGRGAQPSRPSAALSTARLPHVAWRTGAPAPIPRSGPGTEGNPGHAAETTGRLALATLSLSPLPLLENALVALLWIAFEITPPCLPCERHASCGLASSCLPSLPYSLPCCCMP